ncbi:hypothetical protein DB347_03140 [Opitutaceae bacterium EW11]|nr:hypothetical protein DB347_03140 [Opitutaceae bacterium EW11]
MAMSMSAVPAAHPASDSVLLELWDGLVATAPDAPAVIEAADGLTLGRRALDQRASEWLAAVAATRSLKGLRVAFALPNGATWMSVFLGLLKAGATPVPLDASEPPLSQRELARHAGAAFLWTGETLEPVGHARRDLRPLCVVKLTSGSTGVPRALPFTQGEMLADARQVCRTMDIRPEDTNLAIVPFGHSYGLGNLTVPLLAFGVAALCVSAPLPHAIAADVARWRPTVFPAVPALLRVLALSDLPADALASIRTVISAGSALSAETAQTFYQKYHVLVHGFYGSSETGGISYDRSGEATLAGRSVGTPLEGVSTHLSTGQRFCVESAAVFTHGNRRRSGAGFGQYRPADRAELNTLGELVLLGRAGRMMKIAGRRLDLAEFEQSLRRVEGIQDAFAAPHPDQPEELAVVLATTLPVEQVRTRLRGELASWKLPRRLMVVAEFPLTGRGKTDTRALREMLRRESE